MFLQSHMVLAAAPAVGVVSWCPVHPHRYLLVAAEPYETIGFKIPADEIDKSPGKVVSNWNQSKQTFTVCNVAVVAAVAVAVAVVRLRHLPTCSLLPSMPAAWRWQCCARPPPVANQLRCLFQEASCSRHARACAHAGAWCSMSDTDGVEPKRANLNYVALYPSAWLLLLLLHACCSKPLGPNVGGAIGGKQVQHTPFSFQIRSVLRHACGVGVHKGLFISPFALKHAGRGGNLTRSQRTLRHTRIPTSSFLYSHKYNLPTTVCVCVCVCMCMCCALHTHTLTHTQTHTHTRDAHTQCACARTTTCLPPAATATHGWQRNTKHARFGEMRKSSLQPHATQPHAPKKRGGGNRGDGWGGPMKGAPHHFMPRTACTPGPRRSPSTCRTPWSTPTSLRGPGKW